MEGPNIENEQIDIVLSDESENEENHANLQTFIKTITDAQDFEFIKSMKDKELKIFLKMLTESGKELILQLDLEKSKREDHVSAL